jgi:hypothetical protein
VSILAIPLLLALPPCDVQGHVRDTTLPCPAAMQLEHFGITPLQARRGWLDSYQHPYRLRGVIAGGWNNPPHVVALWEADCTYRRLVWAALDDVLYYQCATTYKLQKVAELRRLLGDEAFERGQVPAPTPSAYRIPPYAPSR